MSVIFLVGEGPNDIGGLARTSPYQTNDPGFIQPILERVLGPGITIKGQKITSLPKQPSEESVTSRRGRVAASIAKYEGADALVYVTDVDSASGSPKQRDAERKMESLRAEICRGIAREEGDLKAVVGTPLRTIEAWALADTRAVESVSCAQGLSLEKPPEELWGKPNDERSRHPKQVLLRHFKKARRQLTSDAYAAIARQANLQTIARQCPKSFAPFLDGMERLEL